MPPSLLGAISIVLRRAGSTRNGPDASARAVFFKWSGGESNSRPHHCERCALPTELPPQVGGSIGGFRADQEERGTPSSPAEQRFEPGGCRARASCRETGARIDNPPMKMRTRRPAGRIENRISISPAAGSRSGLREFRRGGVAGRARSSVRVASELVSVRR